MRFLFQKTKQNETVVEFDNSGSRPISYDRRDKWGIKLMAGGR